MAKRKKKTGHGGHRPGAGRPRLMRDSRPITVRIEADDYEALEEIAERRGEAIPSLFRSALDTFIKRHRRR